MARFQWRVTPDCQLIFTKTKRLALALAVAKEVQSAAASFFPNNQMNFPSETLIVSGWKAIR